MDNNQPAQPQPLQQPPPAQTQFQTPVTASSPPGGKNKIVIWIAVGLVVLLLIGGIYWYMSSQKREASSKKIPATGSADTLEKDVNAIRVDEIDGEFSTVDEDLKSL